MIMGDKHATAKAIAADLGVEEVVAGVLPAGKVNALNALREHGPIAFVVDGIRDAPALAHAEARIAIGTVTDVAIESADVVLMSGDLMGVVTALEVSKRTMANIRPDLAWAFAYNTALIPEAAGVPIRSGAYCCCLRSRRGPWCWRESWSLGMRFGFAGSERAHEHHGRRSDQ